MRPWPPLLWALCPLAAAVVRYPVRPPLRPLRKSKFPFITDADALLADKERRTAAEARPPVENYCKHKYSPKMCEWDPSMGRHTAAAVISTWQEDIHWLNELPWSDGLTVLVHDRGNMTRSHGSKMSMYDNWELAVESEAKVKALNSRRSRPINFQVIPNRGDEELAYLDWIVEHYDRLPDVVFFLHGHRCAEHANFDMSVALPSIRECFQPAQGYMDINTYRTGGKKQCRGMKGIMESEYTKDLTGFEMKNFAKVWADLFEKEIGPRPNLICWDTAAQFAVSRDAIRRHPLEFYKKLAEAVGNRVTTMEFFWRMVFDKDAISYAELPWRDRMGKVHRKKPEED